jgi:hypothetical protein
MAKRFLQTLALVSLAAMIGCVQPTGTDTAQKSDKPGDDKSSDPITHKEAPGSGDGDLPAPDESATGGRSTGGSNTGAADGGTANGGNNTGGGSGTNLPKVCAQAGQDGSGPGAGRGGAGTACTTNGSVCMVCHATSCFMCSGQSAIKTCVADRDDCDVCGGLSFKSSGCLVQAGANVFACAEGSVGSCSVMGCSQCTRL